MEHIHPVIESKGGAEGSGPQGEANGEEQERYYVGVDFFHILTGAAQKNTPPPGTMVPQKGGDSRVEQFLKPPVLFND